MANNAKITLMGNLTKDPEMHQTTRGTNVSFGVAVSTSKKNQDGSFKTDFYDVTVWGKQADFLLTRLQKGSGVWVNGDLTLDEYVGRDQQKHMALHVNATDVRGFARLKETGQAAAAPAAQTAMPNFVPDDASALPF